MEIPTFLKCSCGHCGHIIEYLASEAGGVVVCPQCAEKSQLPEVAKLLMVEVEGPPLPVTKNCPKCGAEMKFFDSTCVNCDRIHKQNLRRILSFVAALLVILPVVAWLWVRHSRQAAADTEAQPEKHGTMLIEQPQVKQPKSINDLQPGKFSLEQKRDSDLLMAVGDINNVSENVHHGLKVDVDLLDATGAKIGTITDYSAELGPHQAWHFVARVTDPKVKGVKFASIKEDQ
jgi:hypothetical protein